ncbi:MAG: HAD hydrolase-like protein [Eubacteriales bacterium]|nr:HAD hydrolase-like protein [Eubacteriales bacterium]
MYQTVLLDLDGTLTDSGEGIFNCVEYALEKFGIKVENRESLRRFVGPPLMKSFQTYYAFSDEQAAEAVKYYRERYRDVGLFENVVYDGIVEMLRELSEKGMDLIVATSKPETFTLRIMDHFDLAKYFTLIVGSDDEKGRNTKGKVIAHALTTYAKQKDISLEKAKEQAIMVGDRHHDVDGAKENGIETVGILWGYGDREELVSAGAKYIAELPEKVVEILN